MRLAFLSRNPSGRDHPVFGFPPSASMTRFFRDLLERPGPFVSRPPPVKPLPEAQEEVAGVGSQRSEPIASFLHDQGRYLKRADHAAVRFKVLGLK